MTGFMYYNGIGVVENFGEALSWYMKSAQQGYPEAQFNLGYMHEIGDWVAQDYAKAAEYYQKAVDIKYVVKCNCLRYATKNVFRQSKETHKPNSILDFCSKLG